MLHRKHGLHVLAATLVYFHSIATHLVAATFLESYTIVLGCVRLDQQSTIHMANNPNQHPVGESWQDAFRRQQQTIAATY